MLSSQSKYALRALIYLKDLQSDDFIKVSEIATETGLPAAYLSKLINTLTEQGIILSRRGKNGGIKLSPDKQRVSFYQVCAALKDPLVQDECVLFKKPCNKKSPCPFHHEFSETKQKLIRYLKSTTLGN